MAIERVTVSLPAELRRQAQKIAEEQGLPFSSVVTSALEDWMRGKMLDQLIAEHQIEHGAFGEEELRRAAAEMGFPWPPGSSHRADPAPAAADRAAS